MSRQRPVRLRRRREDPLEGRFEEAEILAAGAQQPVKAAQMPRLRSRRRLEFADGGAERRRHEILDLVAAERAEMLPEQGGLVGRALRCKRGIVAEEAFAGEQPGDDGDPIGQGRFGIVIEPIPGCLAARHIEDILVQAADAMIDCDARPQIDIECALEPAVLLQARDGQGAAVDEAGRQEGPVHREQQRDDIDSRRGLAIGIDQEALGAEAADAGPLLERAQHQIEGLWPQLALTRHERDVVAAAIPQ